MKVKGRPRVTQDVLRGRIVDYCARYGVSQLNAAGFPVYPAGQRETRQHREWVVLFKAFRRLRAAGEPGQDRTAALRSQDGRCPVCSEPVGLEDRLWAAEGREAILVHRHCQQLLQLAAKAGPATLDRVRDHLWPSPAAVTARPKRKSR